MAFAVNRVPLARLVNGPVPMRDTSLCDRTGLAPLALHLPFHTDASLDWAARRAAIVRSMVDIPLEHELFPIVPPLRLGPLEALSTDSERWSDTAAVQLAWQQAWHAAGYHVSPTSATDVSDADLVSMTGDATTQRIERELAALVLPDGKWTQEVHLLLLAYLTLRVLWLYVNAHQRWLTLRVDYDAFTERMPANVIAMYRSDWRLDNARGMPALMQRALVAYRARGSLALTDDVYRTYCSEKLRKNFLLTLTCMRFREILPVNLELLTPCRLAVTKFYAYPRACKMLTADRRHTPRRVLDATPQWFCHLFFARADMVANLERLGVPHLLAFCDRQLWRPVPLEQLRAVPRLLTAVQARFCFYFRDDRALAFVPNLLLSPSDGEPLDEGSPCSMSPHAWQWNCARGEVRDPFIDDAPAVHPDTSDTDARIATSMWRSWRGDVGAWTVASHWLVYWVVLTLWRSEPDACATLRVLRACDLAALRTNYVDGWLAPSLPSAPDTVSWDRCTAAPAPPAGSSVELLTNWRRLFPVACIAMGRAPWIAHWRTDDPLRHLNRTLVAVAQLMRQPEVRRELRTQSSYILRNRQLHALVQLTAAPRVAKRKAPAALEEESTKQAREA